MINFSDALDSLRTLRCAAQQVGEVQIAQGLLDLQGQLLGLQIQVLEQQVDSRMLQDEAARLRSLLSTERKLQRVNDAYFLVNADGEELGPYCATCWDRRELLQALVDGGEGVGYCSHCKTQKVARCPNTRVQNAA